MALPATNSGVKITLQATKNFRVFTGTIAPGFGVAKLGDSIPFDCQWLFFQNYGTVTYTSTFALWLNDILDKAGLEHYTLHSLRHTNITVQIAAGIPLVTVSARAGHAKTSTTSDIYAHFIRSGD